MKRDFLKIRKRLIVGCLAAAIAVAQPVSSVFANPHYDRRDTVAEEEFIYSARTSGTESSRKKVNSKAWKKINGVCYNGSGEIIPGAITRGMDVSEWQGNIDWKQVKRSDIDFAFVRISYGLTHEDYTYDENMTNAELAGVAIMVGNGMGAKNGILFKTAVSLEEAGKIQIVALDKTGTITKGEPQVTDMVPAKGISEEELLGYAYALEKKSEHPLAKAIIARAEEKKIVLQKVSDFQALPGNGLRAALNSDVLTGGNMKFISNETSVSPELMKQAEKLAGEGKTPLLFAKGRKLLGMIAVADVIKEDSPQAIKELQNMGIRVVMLTGDNERTAKAIGAQAGVDDVIAGVLPDGKESVIRSLKEQGKVAMVGDGINDAPALTRADIGIAIGAGTDVAIDAADVVLMKSRLSDVPAAIRLSRATLRNIHENLFWAFFYNVIGIPLAAGVWIPIFGWTLNPMFGAAAMSLSSFCVVTNALRLNLFKVHDASRDKKIKQNVEEIHYISANAEMKNVTENKSLKAENPDFCNSEIHDPKDQENIKENKENKEMTTITVNVTGMMCGHCEAHVTKAVKEAFGVEDVVSSHEKGTTVIHAPEKLDEDKIREVIKEAGYEVTGITQE